MDSWHGPLLDGFGKASRWYSHPLWVLDREQGKNGKKTWSQEDVLEEMFEWKGGLNGEAWKCYSESQRGGDWGKMRIPGQESRERMQK